MSWHKHRACHITIKLKVRFRQINWYTKADEILVDDKIIEKQHCFKPSSIQRYYIPSHFKPFPTKISLTHTITLQAFLNQILLANTITAQAFPNQNLISKYHHTSSLSQSTSHKYIPSNFKSFPMKISLTHVYHHTSSFENQNLINICHQTSNLCQSKSHKQIPSRFKPFPIKISLTHTIKLQAFQNQISLTYTITLQAFLKTQSFW